jgi:phytoene dehydrogenase-like protein
VEILAEADRVRGVRLAGGEVVEAPIVVVATDARRAIVEWLARPPAAAAAMVRRFDARPVTEGYESKIDAVLSAPPRYRAVDDALLARNGVEDALIPTTIVSPSLPEIAAAHDAMAAGEVATQPMFYVNAPSVVDPTLRAGDDHVFSLEVLFTPYRLRGGWPGSREPQRWLDRFGDLAEPGFTDTVRRWRVTTPPDYERDFNLTKGHAPSFPGGPLSALLRRDPELTGYETAVRGLYLTGAATFPGAGVWGASGRGAAHVILGHAASPRRRCAR